MKLNKKLAILNFVLAGMQIIGLVIEWVKFSNNHLLLGLDLLSTLLFLINGFLSLKNENINDDNKTTK